MAESNSAPETVSSNQTRTSNMASPNEDYQSLKEDLAILKEDLARLSRNSARSAQDYAQHQTDRMRECVQERPGTSLLVALGAGFLLGALLALGVLLVIGNTIRLAIENRRDEILVVKLVGATDPFIQRPFLVEGMLQGLLAGLLAGILLWATYLVLLDYIPQLAMPAWTLLVMLVGVTLCGLLLGWLGSFVAARRFIRNVALH